MSPQLTTVRVARSQAGGLLPDLIHTYSDRTRTRSSMYWLSILTLVGRQRLIHRHHPWNSMIIDPHVPHVAFSTHSDIKVTFPNLCLTSRRAGSTRRSPLTHQAQDSTAPSCDGVVVTIVAQLTIDLVFEVPELGYGGPQGRTIDHLPRRTDGSCYPPLRSTHASTWYRGLTTTRNQDTGSHIAACPLSLLTIVAPPTILSFLSCGATTGNALHALLRPVEQFSTFSIFFGAVE